VLDQDKLLHRMILLQVLLFTLLWSVAAVRGVSEYGKACSEPCLSFCPMGWERKGQHCFFWSQDSDNEAISWEDAEGYCKLFGAHLASATSSDVYDYMKSKISSDTWIGATNQTENGTWVWTDCSSFNSQSPAQGGGSCAHLTVGGQGSNEKKCGEKLTFICSKPLCPGEGSVTLGGENDNTDEISRKIGGGCQSCVEEHRCQGWQRLSSQGSHCYRLFQEKKTWVEAEQHCNDQGGHLADVTNQEIHNYINGKYRQVWVGGTDEGTEGRWRWSDCSTWGFEQWSDGELFVGPFKQPNNGGRFPPNNCLQLRYYPLDDKWHDQKCSDQQQFVCSKKLCPPTTTTITTTTTTTILTTTTERNLSNLGDKNSTNVNSTSDQVSEPDLEVKTIVFYVMTSIPVSMTLFGLIYMCRTNCNLKERFCCKWFCKRFCCKCCKCYITTNLEKKEREREENPDYGTYYYHDGTHRLNVMEATDSNTEYGFMEDSDIRTMERNSQYGNN